MYNSSIESFLAMDKLFWKNKNKEDLPGEIWVDAYGFDGIYEVSNKGRIRSLDRLIRHPNGERMVKGINKQYYLAAMKHIKWATAQTKLFN